jgi:hypothetical protein
MAGFGIDFSPIEGRPAPDYLGNYLAAQQGANQQRQQAATQSALAQYGSDPDGAIKSLIQAGALNQANALQTIQDGQRQRATQMSEGAALADANGDPTKLQAAAATAARSGDIKGYNDIQAQVQTMTAQQKAVVAARTEAAAKVLAGANAIGDDDSPANLSKRAEYIKAQAPDLIAQGVDPGTIQQYALHPDSNTLQGGISKAQSLGDILKGQQSDAELQLKKDTLKDTSQYHTGMLANGAISAHAAATNASAHVMQAQTGQAAYQTRRDQGGYGPMIFTGTAPAAGSAALPKDFKPDPPGGDDQ